MTGTCPHIWKQHKGNMFYCELCDSWEKFPITYDECCDLAVLQNKYGKNAGFQMWKDGVKAPKQQLTLLVRTVEKGSAFPHKKEGGRY